MGDKTKPWSTRRVHRSRMRPEAAWSPPPVPPRVEPRFSGVNTSSGPLPKADRGQFHGAINSLVRSRGVVPALVAIGAARGGRASYITSKCLSDLVPYLDAVVIWFLTQIWSAYEGSPAPAWWRTTEGQGPPPVTRWHSTAAWRTFTGLVGLTAEDEAKLLTELQSLTLDGETQQ